MLKTKNRSLPEALVFKPNSRPIERDENTNTTMKQCLHYTDDDHTVIPMTVQVSCYRTRLIW